MSLADETARRDDRGQETANQERKGGYLQIYVELNKNLYAEFNEAL